MKNAFLLQMDSSVRNYKRALGVLLKDVIQADRKRVYLKEGYSSLFSFMTRYYELSEAVTSDFIRVGRLAQKIPEVATAVEKQKVSISKLRKVAPVMTRENALEWIQKAKTQSARELEKQVAELRPEATRKSFIKPLGKGNHRVLVDTGEETSQKMERAMEITGKPLADTLETMVDFYLKHHCPLKKAERVTQKNTVLEASVTRQVEEPTLAQAGKLALEVPVTEQAEKIEPEIAPVTEQESQKRPSQKRKPIPAVVKHTVNLRDQGQCTFHVKGKRCEGRRFLHIHHRIPVAKGGKNTVENLMTLCSRHHAWAHELSRE